MALRDFFSTGLLSSALAVAFLDFFTTRLLSSALAALGGSAGFGASTGFFGQSLKLVDLAARAVLAAFDRLTGLHLLADVQSFVSGFDGMYGGFAERAERAPTEYWPSR